MLRCGINTIYFIVDSVIIDVSSTTHEIIRKIMMLAPKNSKVSHDALDPEEAKKKVFEYWKQLEALSKRRFPQNDNLSQEALLYIVDKLETDRWKRIRAWQGLGHFLPFLMTMASRLLTDFSREKFGYIRKPTWLREKKDPLWDRAYRLLILNKYKRHEAIEVLRSIEPKRELWLIEEIIDTVRTRCQKYPNFSEQQESLDDKKEQPSCGNQFDQTLEIQDKEMIEALQFLFQKDGAPPVTHRVKDIVAIINPHINLTREDKLLLRLRFQDGLKMENIVKLMQLHGNPYKRYDKIIRHLRLACQQAGIINS